MRNSKPTRKNSHNLRSKGTGSPSNVASERVPGEGGGRWRRVELIVCFLAALGGAFAILASGRTPLEVSVGERARRDLQALSSVDHPNIERTQAAREYARRAAPLAFRSAQQKYEASRTALLAALAKKPPASWQHIQEEALRRDMQALTARLQQNREALRQALDRLGRLPLVSVSQWGSNPRWPAEALVYDQGGEQHRLDMHQIVPLSEDDPRFRQPFGAALSELSDQEQETVLKAFARTLSPSLELDVEGSARLAQQAAEAVVPVTETISRGEVILQKGSMATEGHVARLKADREAFRSSMAGRRLRYQRLFGLAVILLVLGAAVAVYLARYRPELIGRRRQRLSFALVVLAIAGIARGFVLLDVPLVLVPVPLAVMVMSLVYDQRFGFATAVLFALLVGIAAHEAGIGFVVLMLGGMIAALLTGQVRTRTTLLKAGLVAGCAQWAALWGFGLLTAQGQLVAPPWPWQSALFADSLSALGNGVISGFLVTGLLPLIERLFGVTTDIRLLEWSDPHQSLLQRLLREAPGTYHHSMMVGSLAADAAEAVGANPLLARVSAYFHDIGKLKNPAYFAENMAEGEKNPHDDLSPTMSKLIITAHPRDGAQMASEHGLPREVRDIILQSHGSTTTKYFWNRAKAQGEENDQEVRESSFRYRQPKPRSKEGACVMLADASESATRSLESPSPARVAELVHEILMDRLHDGQLDESGLTITDLDRAGNALAHGLTATLHSRVRYPGQQEPEQQTAGEQHG